MVLKLDFDRYKVKIFNDFNRTSMVLKRFTRSELEIFRQYFNRTSMVLKHHLRFPLKRERYILIAPVWY